MRNRLSALTVAVGVLAPGALLAQDATPFYLSGGPTFPMGRIDDGWNTGLNAGAGVMLRQLSARLGLRADVSYSRLPFDEEALLARAGVPAGTDVRVDGGGVGLFTALALLQWRLAPAERPYRPYLLVGFGYWREALEDLNVRGPEGTQGLSLEGDSDNGIAGALGTGFEFGLRPGLGAFVEGAYAIGWDFGDPPDLDETWLPLRIGVVFNP